MDNINPYRLKPTSTGAVMAPVSFFMDHEEHMVLLAKFLAFVFLILAVSY